MKTPEFVFDPRGDREWQIRYTSPITGIEDRLGVPRWDLLLRGSEPGTTDHVATTIVTALAMQAEIAQENQTAGKENPRQTATLRRLALEEWVLRQETSGFEDPSLRSVCLGMLHGIWKKDARGDESLAPLMPSPDLDANDLTTRYTFDEISQAVSNVQVRLLEESSRVSMPAAS